MVITDDWKPASGRSGLRISSGRPFISLTSLSLVLVQSVLLCSGANGHFRFGVQKFLDKQIPYEGSHIVNEEDLKCDCQLVCWQMCRSNSTCMAVTVKFLTWIARECKMSSQFLVEADLNPSDPLSYLASNSQGSLKTITYVKACDGVFEGVQGARCYHFSRKRANFTWAKTSCPYGSHLASPSNLTTFQSLVRHLNNAARFPVIVTEQNWWVDIVKKDPVWVWGDGNELASAQGTFPWAGYAPNEDGVTNARMSGAQNFLLDDANSTREFCFICQPSSYPTADKSTPLSVP